MLYLYVGAVHCYGSWEEQEVCSHISLFISYSKIFFFFFYLNSPLASWYIFFSFCLHMVLISQSGVKVAMSSWNVSCSACDQKEFSLQSLHHSCFMSCADHSDFLTRKKLIWSEFEKKENVAQIFISSEKFVYIMCLASKNNAIT